VLHIPVYSSGQTILEVDLGAKANSRSALDTSSFRRGCPSGLVESQIIAPEKPVFRAINSTSCLIWISKLLPRFTGSGLSYRIAARTMLAQHLRRRGIRDSQCRSPDRDFMRLLPRGFYESPDQSGNHM